MRFRPALAFGWLLAIPGFAIVVALAILETPAFDLIGCRTAGILSISCDSDVVSAVANALLLILLVAASFPPLAGLALLYSLGFSGWRGYVARRAAAVARTPRS
jgi:hypothetical protein